MTNPQPPAPVPGERVAQALADAERIEAAAAVLERRYPAARPDVLDTTISELHSVARVWRRIAASEAQSPAVGTVPDYTGAVVLCPGCLHDGVLERTLERAEAAERKLATIGRKCGQPPECPACWRGEALVWTADILAIIGSEETRVTESWEQCRG